MELENSTHARGTRAGTDAGDSLVVLWIVPACVPHAERGIVKFHSRPRDAGGYILWKLRLQILRAEVDLHCLAHIAQVPALPERPAEGPPRAGAVGMSLNVKCRAAIEREEGVWYNLNQMSDLEVIKPTKGAMYVGELQ